MARDLPRQFSSSPEAPPESVARLPEAGIPKSPRGSGTFSSDQPNSPTMPEQSSDRPFPTLRRTPSNSRRTSDNSPPYFDASTAESLIKQGGESRHVGRRVPSSKTERVSTRKRQGGRETALPLSFGFLVPPPIYNRRRENRENGFPYRFSIWKYIGKFRKSITIHPIPPQ